MDNYGYELDGHTAMARENIKIQTADPVQQAALECGPISHGIRSARPSEQWTWPLHPDPFPKVCNPEDAACMTSRDTKLTPCAFSAVTILTDDYPFVFLAAFRRHTAMLFTVAAPRPASPPHASVCFLPFPGACFKLAMAILQRSRVLYGICVGFGGCIGLAKFFSWHR
jgi:hypothetical protein